MTAIVKQSASDPCRFFVEGELTIYNALELKGQLLERVEGACTQLEFDLAGVTEIDSAGIQLLVMAKNEAISRGKNLRITGHSAVVLEVLDLCNLEGFFGDPVLIRPQE